MKNFPEASWVCEGQLQSALERSPQPAMLSQAEKAAEGKTDPVGFVWLGKAVSLRLPTSPWDVFQAFLYFSILGQGVHGFYKRMSPKNTPHQRQRMSCVHLTWDKTTLP